MSDGAFLDTMYLAVLGPAITLLAAVGLYIRTGHRPIWGVAVVVLPIAAWLASTFFLPGMLVRAEISPRSFLTATYLSELVLPLLLALLTLKRWPAPRGRVGEII